MPTRRSFLAAGFAVLPLAACAPGADAGVTPLRAPLPVTPAFADLVRFATLAPNSHNSQPWRFHPTTTGAIIAPDLARRLAIVDPDDHHLFVSLGAAAETFAVASAGRGRPAAIAVQPDASVAIDTVAGPTRDDPRFAAIVRRQSTRSLFDGRPVAAADLAALASAGSGDAVTCALFTAPNQREAIAALVVAGNSAQLDDPAFVAELRHWVRFNAASAAATGDGLFSGASGQATVPTWLGNALFTRVLSKDSDNARYVAQLRSSAGVAVFTGARADRATWIAVGRAFQRFALTATALGIRTAMVNQALEVPAVRADLARWLGTPGLRPDLVVRFGYAPALPFSWRRPAAAVIG